MQDVEVVVVGKRLDLIEIRPQRLRMLALSHVAVN
jgi:hypothetical protein